jgi:dTMP kinase
MKKKKGKLIVIDGTDGSGKATQTKLLVKKIAESRKVQTTDFPRYDTNQLGGLIRECLDGLHGDFIAMDPKVVSVLYAVDRFETLPIIRQWLNSGDIVVLDRFVSANQIHQGGKIRDPKSREDFLKWLDKLEFGILGLPRPDVIVYLHVPVEVSVELARTRAISKGQAPDEAEKNTRHQLESQESALSIIKSSNNWIKIDCAPNGKLLPAEEVHAKLWTALQPILN